MTETLTLRTCKRTEEYRDGGTINTDEARHLFRVAAGLESPLLGETAILGQIRKAYDEARAGDKLTPNMNKLFQTAIHVGHRVRTETAISRGAVSYSQVTVELLMDALPDITHSVVSIIGVNDLTESILNFLSAKGATNIILANRSIERARQMAASFHATAVSLSEKRQLLRVSDAVVCATSAPHSIIHREDFTTDHDVTLFDLANPRDVDEDVRSLPGKRLFDLGQIEGMARQNIDARRQAVKACEEIIEEEIAELKRWERYRHETRQVKTGV